MANYIGILMRSIDGLIKFERDHGKRLRGLHFIAQYATPSRTEVKSVVRNRFNAVCQANGKDAVPKSDAMKNTVIRQFLEFADNGEISTAQIRNDMTRMGEQSVFPEEYLSTALTQLKKIERENYLYILSALEERLILETETVPTTDVTEAYLSMLEVCCQRRALSVSEACERLKQRKVLNVIPNDQLTVALKRLSKCDIES